MSAGVGVEHHHFADSTIADEENKNCRTEGAARKSPSGATDKGGFAPD